MLSELELARNMVSEGIKKPLPVPGTNYILVALRITGTGYAYRSKSKSFVYRNPSDYLTDDVLDMCNGLPVIIEHEEDKKGINENTEAIGTVFYPYIKESEVWGIAKIWKIDALESVIDDERISTSPSFVCKTVAMENKTDTVRQDLAPVSCNHIAILPNGLMGVWDKYDTESQAIHLFNDSQEVRTMPDLVEGAVQEGEGNQATLEKILNIAQQALDAVTAMSARVDKLEQGEKGEPAPPASAEPVPKADATDVVVEPETEAKPAEPTISELAEKIKAMDAASYGGENDMQEKAELLNDAENLHYMFKTPLIKSPGTESAGQLRRRLFRAEIDAAKTLGINSPWLNESIETMNDSTLAIAHGQLKTQIFSAKPKAEEGQTIMSYVKKGRSGLANETHFVVGDKASYFQSH